MPNGGTAGAFPIAASDGVQGLVRRRTALQVQLGTITLTGRRPEKVVPLSGQYESCILHTNEYQSLCKIPPRTTKKNTLLVKTRALS